MCQAPQVVTLHSAFTKNTSGKSDILVKDINHVLDGFCCRFIFIYLFIFEV